MKILKKWDFWYWFLIAIFFLPKFIEAAVLSGAEFISFFSVEFIIVYAFLKGIQAISRSIKTKASTANILGLIFIIIFFLLYLGYMYALMEFASAF